VLLGTSAGGHLAGDHVSFFGGRSTFVIFLRLPRGRDQTLKYLEQLSDWQRKGAKGDIPRDIPQFPANTQVALARRTVLLDDRGEIRPTPLTEKVQLRILHDPTTKDGVQTFLQFRLRREQLLAGKAGGLGAVPDDEGEWDYLFNLGLTVIDRGFIRPIMTSCGGCHGNAPGVASMNSFARGSLQNEWVVTSLGDEEGRIGAWKREQESWKQLEEVRRSPASR
jgi:hypothetical protein